MSLKEEVAPLKVYNGVELPRFVDGREVISYPNASAPLLNSIKKKKFKVVPSKLKQFITCHDCGHIVEIGKPKHTPPVTCTYCEICDDYMSDVEQEDYEAYCEICDDYMSDVEQEEMESIDWVKRNETMIDFTIDRSNEPDTEPESDTDYEAYCEICDDYMSDVEQEDYEAGCNSICDGCAPPTDVEQEEYKYSDYEEWKNGCLFPK